MRIQKFLVVFFSLTLLATMLMACDKTERPSQLPETTEERREPMTKFEEQFSIENEKLLATILEGEVKGGNVLKAMPELSVKYKERISSGESAYTYVYQKVTKATYDECCEKLREAGYAQYTETQFNGKKYNSSIENKNFFTTFVSNSMQIDVGFHVAAARMYVTVTPRTKSDLPLREALTYTPAGEEYPTILTQVGTEDLTTEQSSCYIMRIADGSFIIVDGGMPIESVGDRIFNILKMQAPDPDNIVISAWILTHGHADHVGGFVSFAEKYGSNSAITLKQLVYNFPNNTKIPDDVVYWQNAAKTAAIKFKTKPTVLRPHAGNVLYYADVAINVLYTQEEYLAVDSYFGNYNTSSMVTQFVMSDGTKFLMGADHPVDGSSSGYTWCQAALWKWYGAFIESEVVSIFHHGNGGGADMTVYAVIKPKFVLWPGTVYFTNLYGHVTFPHNTYFTDSGAAGRGVEGYYLAANDITILTFSGGNITVTEYDSFKDYKAGTTK